MFDKDEDGLITAGEFSATIKSIGIMASDKEVRAMIDCVAGTDQIDFDTFCKIMRNESQSGDTEEDLVRVLSALDRKKDGTISAAELKHIMVHLGSELNYNEVCEMIKEAGFDDKGRMNYVEFASKLFQKA